MECSGLCWTKKASGKIIVSSHKDRAGDLDAPIKKPLAVIVGTWSGEGDARGFSYTIEKPEQQEDVAGLSLQIMDAVIDALVKRVGRLSHLCRVGAVKGSSSAKDSTIETLIRVWPVVRHEEWTSQYVHPLRPR